MSAAFLEGHNEAQDYYATQVLRHVVLRERRYNPAVQLHEFTDWEALSLLLEKRLLPCLATALTSAKSTETAKRSMRSILETAFIDAPDVSGSIASAAGVLAQLRNACCIATYKETGATALPVSKTRSDVPIVAVCTSEKVVLPLSLVWGVTPVINTNAEEFGASRDGRIPQSLPQIRSSNPTDPLLSHPASNTGKQAATTV